MTTRLKHLLLIISIVFSGVSVVEGQGDNNKTKYRISAVKKFEPAVVSESNITEINLPLAIYIPNAFTPNGDGLNDNFSVEGEGISKFNMSIYNKWGEMIFESGNLHESWDGTYGGELVQDGAYVYMISLVSADKKSMVKNGTVTVLK